MRGANFWIQCFERQKVQCCRNVWIRARLHKRIKLWHTTLFSQLPLVVRSFSKWNRLQADERRENPVVMWRPEHAWARRQETTATTDPFSSLIGLQPVSFWKKISSPVGVLQKTMRVIILFFYVILIQETFWKNDSNFANKAKLKQKPWLVYDLQCLKE